MSKTEKGKTKIARKTGPKPETLVLDRKWKDAVGEAMRRGKPPSSKPKKKRRPK